MEVGWQAYRACWGWWMQADLVPLKRLSFYLGSLLHIIRSLFSHFCLFLHKILKLGFWNFKPIFLRMQSPLVSTFFSLVLIISLNWYLHLEITLRELILGGINFHEFHEFLAISLKLVHAKIIGDCAALLKFAKINSREMRTFDPWKKQFRKIFSYQNSQSR